MSGGAEQDKGRRPRAFGAGRRRKTSEEFSGVALNNGLSGTGSICRQKTLRRRQRNLHSAAGAPKACGAVEKTAPKRVSERPEQSANE